MKIILLNLFLFLSLSAFSQESIDDLLKQYNTHSVPYISVQELAMPKTEAIILDAREFKEYSVSHIKNALHIGYDTFQIDSVLTKIPEKNKNIVVYCSIGIRSEMIALKLKKSGFTNVKNLYGGIFEWKNYDFPVYDQSGKETEYIHAFSEEWGKWLKKGKKVYD